MEATPGDIRALIRDKYDGDASADLRDDIERLAAGEPLAYVIGWIPFLGLHIDLSSHPLIPRPETEWWTEQLIAHLREKYENKPFTFLDLCAGSGAIGLAVSNAFPHADVSFGEIDPAHVAQIEANVLLNGLDLSRAHMRESDLFEAFQGEAFDVIATNPPYIPTNRALPSSVALYEPHQALFADTDGLSYIRRIAEECGSYLNDQGELWLECDSEHAKEAAGLFSPAALIHEDQYGRPRFLVHTKG